MKIPTWKRITREDLGAVPPGMGDLLDRILDPINRQMEQMSTAFQNSVSFVDNHNSERILTKLSHGVSVEMKLRTLKGKPIDAVLTWTDAATAGRLHWEAVSRDTIMIKVTWDTDPGEPTLARILVFGE